MGNHDFCHGLNQRLRYGGLTTTLGADTISAAKPRQFCGTRAVWILRLVSKPCVRSCAPEMGPAFRARLEALTRSSHAPLRSRWKRCCWRRCCCRFRYRTDRSERRRTCSDQLGAGMFQPPTGARVVEKPPIAHGVGPFIEVDMRLSHPRREKRLAGIFRTKPTREASRGGRSRAPQVFRPSVLLPKVHMKSMCICPDVASDPGLECPGTIVCTC